MTTKDVFERRHGRLAYSRLRDDGTRSTTWLPSGEPSTSGPPEIDAAFVANELRTKGFEAVAFADVVTGEAVADALADLLARRFEDLGADDVDTAQCLQIARHLLRVRPDSDIAVATLVGAMSHDTPRIRSAAIRASASALRTDVPTSAMKIIRRALEGALASGTDDDYVAGARAAVMIGGREELRRLTLIWLRASRDTKIQLTKRLAESSSPIAYAFLTRRLRDERTPEVVFKIGLVTRAFLTVEELADVLWMGIGLRSPIDRLAAATRVRELPPDLAARFSNVTMDEPDAHVRHALEESLEHLGLTQDRAELH